MATFGLILNHLRQRKIRSALTVAAIAISVSLVVSVAGAFLSIEVSATRMFGAFYGTVDVYIKPKTLAANDLIGPELVERLRADTDRVERVDPMLSYKVKPLDANQNVLGGKVLQVIGSIQDKSTTIIKHKLAEGRWYQPDETNVAVLNERAAEIMRRKVGEYFYLRLWLWL